MGFLFFCFLSINLKVIDFGLAKGLSCDSSTNLMTLQLSWSTKSSMDQRRGRAGRVQNGFCYRLITKEFYNKHILDFPMPEIQRAPLESLILKVKRFSNDTAKRTLSLALTPPRLDDIERSVLLLKEVRNL
jgi:ATP-dependent RNA helicase TDRD9